VWLRPAVGYLESRGIDPEFLHLHRRDIVASSDTPYFAGFQLRYISMLPRYFAEFGEIEHLEVVHPTRSKPLDCLRITPLDAEYCTSCWW
jgi:hypothetical protein